ERPRPKLLAEDLFELDWNCKGELLEGARARRLVGSPAQERGAVAESPPAEPRAILGRLGVAWPVVEGDLAHPVRPQRVPIRHFLAGAPPTLTAPATARPAFVGWAHETGAPGIELAVRLEKRHQLAFFGRLEGRGEPDVMQRAVVVVQPQQQRADRCADLAAIPAKGADHAVGGALVLDLQHRPPAGNGGGARGFWDHT